MNKITVIGDGVVGLTIGIKLRMAGHNVSVIGSGRRTGGASAAAGAMLGVYGEITRFSHAGVTGAAKHALARSATEAWPEWISTLANGTGRSARTAEGTFVILNSVGTNAVDSENFATIQETLTADGAEWERVSPEEVPGLDPDELARPLDALYIASENAVDASVLLTQLESMFEGVGGTRVRSSVKRLEGGRSTTAAPEVRLADGSSSHADIVVLAAGAFSQELLDCFPEVAERIPRMVSGYGVSMLVEARDPHDISSVVRTPNRAFACGLHVVPRGERSVYLGGTNILSMCPRSTALLEDVQFLMDCATQQIARHFSHGGLTAIQVGNRPVPLDGAPVIGWTGIDGLYVASGTYRDGLTLSPRLSDLILADIEQDGTPDELVPFTPQRPPTANGTRAEIVQEAVDHMVATGYEHAWTVPNDWTQRIRRLVSAEFVEAAEAIHPDFTPPPEILAGIGTRPELRAALDRYYRAWT